MTANAPPDPRIHAIEGWRRLLVWPLGLLVRLWCRTLRFEVSEEAARLLAQTCEPVLATLWHNRLFVIAEIRRRFRPHHRVYGLVSASKDGAWLAAFFESVGIHAVRGSSSRFGRQAMHALADRINAGDDVGITPDGPRGPCYDFKAGGIILARRTGALTVLLGIRYGRARRLPSWDGFAIPRPFSRVYLHAEAWPVAKLELEPNPVETLRSRLLALNPDESGPARAIKSRPAG